MSRTIIAVATAGAIVWTGLAVFTWSLCRAAARGDSLPMFGVDLRTVTDEQIRRFLDGRS